MDRPPTFREIAAAAGVSIATVSLALRADPRISAATRQRVEGAARRLGHEPSPLVSAFMARIRRSAVTGRGAGETFALLLPVAQKAEDPLTRELRAGCREQARRLGLGLDEVRIDGESRAATARVDRILAARGIRGLVIAPFARWGTALELNWERYASVAIGYSLLDPRLAQVAPDHQQGMRVMITELRQRGCARIGYIVDDASVRTADKRLLARFALYTAMTPEPVEVPPLIIPTQETGDRAGVARSFARWFRRHRPAGIISSFSEVPDWLRSGGWRIPEDVQFCHENVANAPAGVSGLDQKPRLVAATAVSVALSLIVQNAYGVPETPILTLIPGSWRDGATTLPAAQLTR